MNLSRRSLLIAAPAVILTPHLLMPVRTEKIVAATPYWTWDTPPWKEGAFMWYSSGHMFQYRGGTWWPVKEVRTTV